jgi:hypothetical protein
MRRMPVLTGCAVGEEDGPRETARGRGGGADDEEGWEEARVAAGVGGREVRRIGEIGRGKGMTGSVVVLCCDALQVSFDGRAVKEEQSEIYEPRPVKASASSQPPYLSPDHFAHHRMTSFDSACAKTAPSSPSSLERRPSFPSFSRGRACRDRKSRIGSDGVCAVEEEAVEDSGQVGEGGKA